MAKIDAFFKLMHEQGASDLHLVAGQPPALRMKRTPANMSHAAYVST